MADIKNIDDVLEQLKAYNERKMQALFAAAREKRLKQKLERANHSVNDAVKKVEEVIEESVEPKANETLDRWKSLLDQLGKK
ncbi:hypothetical protein [Paenibacillus sp. 1001270B_150601_E10]|uniref:hypothetical protein n=1 Tax=Paenibacillus sp. 1001270B_150601_E10 TaxID=2787079 RepID=UPI00189D4912|nr:hypothetical protein [Paenibacillus sp. 1001270B_150601_E10]